jgi:dephospho-CoA kinase
MTIIGIAGGSGTGKSTVAAHLARRLGGEHIDADAVAHELLAGDPDVIEAVRERFGDEVFDASGGIDRRALGERVFSQRAARLELNAILHPLIRRVCGQRVEVARESGAGAAVVDAALLLDSQMPFDFDLMIALQCDTETRFRRIMAKGGRGEVEVRRRLESQRDIEKSFYKADVVVDTDGELDDVLAEIDRVVDAAGDRE